MTVRVERRTPPDRGVPGVTTGGRPSGADAAVRSRRRDDPIDYPRTED